MDPQYERRLRDEVIYLHSLWHQGPPTPTPTPTPVLRHHLHPTKSTQFKKQRKKPQNNNSTSTLEWPCPPFPPPSTTTTGWQTTPANPKPPLPLSPTENSKLASNNAQQNALKTVHKFFTRNNTDESNLIDSSSSEDDDDSDHDELVREEDGREDYSFFVKLFGDDPLLKEHYEKNYVEGRFICLVCGAMKGKKAGKKYTSCLGLVQHSITISNTKKRRAHRAFGQAVCKILGWDIDQLPTIVSLLSERKSGDLQVEANGNLEDVGMENSHVEEVAAEGLTTGPRKENNDVGNETQELQIDNVVLDGLKEDSENEN